MIANHHNLDNLTVIIDRNRIQSLTFTEDTLKLEPFADKWKAFGWETRIENGHDHEALLNALIESRGPKCVIAETTKGKGVDFMENSVLWHYKSPEDEDVKRAFSQFKVND
jgi:transketolase